MKLLTENRGFTLVELFLVLSVISIIATIAIPQLLRVRMGTNEASAVASVRVIANAEGAYQAAVFRDADGNAEGDYGTLGQLGNPDGAGVAEPFIDSELASGAKSGYSYVVNVTDGSNAASPTFVVLSFPSIPGRSGLRQFYADETMVLRHTTDGTAVSPTSPPLQ